MTNAATTADAEDSVWDDPLRILTSKVPVLKAVWKKLDHSGFEHATKDQLRLALLKRAFRKEFASEHESETAPDKTTVSPFSIEKPPMITTSQPSSGLRTEFREKRAAARQETPTMSFKEAISSPARSPVPSSHCNDFEKRLAEAEFLLKEHKQKLREMDRKAEALDRQSKQLSLIVYNVPETAEKDTQGVVALDRFLFECMPDFDTCEHDWKMQRLGTYCHDQKRPRPVRMTFGSNNDKHAFLKHAKHLKEIGFRYDDDLTRLQQKERQDLSADFNTLKTKGHKPVYRGSSLKFRHADKTRTCRRNGASRAPDAQA